MDGLDNSAGAANAIDRAQVMLVASLGQVAALQVHAQAGSEHRLFDVVGGQRIAGKELIDVAASQQPANVLGASRVHDRPAADQQALAPFATSLEPLGGNLADPQALR